MDRKSTSSFRPQMRRTAHRLGALAVLALMPAIAYGLGQLAWSQAQVVASHTQFTSAAGLDTLALGQILSPLAAALGSLVAAHLTWTALALTLAPRRSRLRGWVAALTPSAWRRLVTMATAGTLSIALAVPVAAATETIAVDTTDAGWVAAPAAATTEATPPPPTVTPTPAAETTEATGASALVHEPEGERTSLVVSPGDTLWDLTATQLGIPTHDHAAIAAAWPALYEENRDAIGADPGLIVPDQRLTIPAEWNV